MKKSSESLLEIAQRLCKEKKQLPAATESKESSLLFMGNKGVGKTSLIYRFLDRNETAKPTLALEYAYGRKSGKSLVKDVCHIWELGGGTLFSGLLQAPLASCQSHGLKNLTVVLMLDLSLPKQLWLTLETLIQGLLSALRRQTGSHLQELQEEAWLRVGKDHQDKEYLDPFPVQLVILGGKYDLFQEFDPEKKKIVCRSLRYVAHTLGATLLFYSHRDTGLVKKAKDVLNHHAFGALPVKGISQDYNNPLLIPAGSDSMEQIGRGFGSFPQKGAGSALERWKHSFTTHFPQEAETNAIPDDPAKDLNFREPLIDSLRAQKDEELERYRQEAEKRQQHQQN
ncbi:cytoplasmic dynein 2 light intermediate chain 1 [Schistocerca cancellata]|uniref:cytoplasmic dynein 2 light intermediate chain 1 n=1 Tax=Schistocerca cancellata TaxID=274614 RepID=UPI0021184E16|nr:cytoplasmic dynein 2 light intermediate chain 1 [Schistocerca cancellata]